ncbi:helix-turn-helix domain-containing protein [Antrihabitans stalactiti]|uniref:TetR/AcrR family transcriptional regulator n=1 Tax=Antrihabitans stalactiti TaxID=2584121 RepID=UPI0030B82A6C
MTNTPTARERLVDGARQVFSERGIAGTSLSDIVERSGAPRGSMYHYFPAGKEQLAEESTTAAGRMMASTISGLCATKGPAEALSVIVNFFRKQLVNSEYTAGCPVAAGALEGGEAPSAGHAAGDAFAAWEQILAAALWQHGMPKAKAEVLATTAVAAVEGAIIIARAQRSTTALDRVEKALLASVLTVE